MKVTKIKGLKEIEDALSALEPKLQASILRAANRKAVKKYVVDRLRSALPYSAESKKGIAVMAARDDKTAVTGGITSDSYWLRWADKGTADRYTKSGAYRGRILGKNQVEPIIMGSVDDIIKWSTEELGNEVAKILERRLKSTRNKISKL